MSVDPARFLADLHALRAFGRDGHGVHRPTYSPDDLASREWFAGRLRDAGLRAGIDGIGNVLGEAPGTGPRLLLGSHLETQPHGGWLDGALGCIAALEVARALGGGIDVAAWADEEGHFGAFNGSRSAIGDLSEADIDAAANRDGTPLRAALATAGYASRPRLRLDPARYRGYLELHIEQGPELDTTGQALGVVTAIVGLRGYRVRFEGQQNHAGTTPMAHRRDAGAALVRLAGAIAREFPTACAPRTVWTVGRIELEPGAPSIIPGAATMLFQIRDTDEAVLDRLEALLLRLAAEEDRGPCRVGVTRLRATAPAIMAPALRAALEAACERAAPGNWQAMPSGAGHDAQQLARIMPAAMLFAPSIGGISHDVAEDTREDDLVRSVQALADAAAQLLR
ncbi:MAG: hydantoinase/carbamoylase family amidase [Rhodospirillales bacterium]|nr:hydantoinase/carbamoylase family amidase [Rhodospirillales bacterium]